MKATFYESHDNRVQMTLTEDDVAIDLSTVTNVVVKTALMTFSLEVNPTIIVKLPTTIELRLGGSGLLIGVHHAIVVVYTATTPTGIVFDDALALEMKHG